MLYHKTPSYIENIASKLYTKKDMKKDAFRKEI